jgi:hypothetical protein
MPQTGTGGPFVGQTVKESAIVQIAARRVSKASRNGGCSADIRKYRHQIVGLASLLRASNRDRRTIRRTNGEGIGDCPNRRAPRFKGKPQSLLSRGPIKSWLTPRCGRRSSSGPPAGHLSKLVRPTLAKRCSTDGNISYRGGDGGVQTCLWGMIENLTSWLNSLPAWASALVLCAFFLTLTLAGIILIHPLMRRAIHSEGQANDVVIFAAANYGLIYAVLLGLLTVANFQTTKSSGTEIKDLQDKSPALANITARTWSSKTSPRPRHPAALEVYLKLGLLT